MNPRTWRRPTSTIAAAILLSMTAGADASERLMLDRPAIICDPDQPPYVQYALEDLAGYLKDISGISVVIGASSNDNVPPTIAAVTGTASQFLGEKLAEKHLGDEGYILKTVDKNGTRMIIAAGATPRGTRAAVYALMKRIQVDGKVPFVTGPLDLRSTPAFAKRGMHFNGWALGYPYTFRSWREEDWCRYLDILAYQGVNLFYLWPFIEIMPVPLSAEDQAYLEECRRVVNYAQKKLGMEVWIMQCTNRVAADRCGVADPRLRPYWRASQQDLNPANPEHFKAIMASREAMYRVINNADGVCNIDCDPGFLPGSPLTDYVKVMQGCRALLDRHSIHGKQAKFINWVLWGWGRMETFQIKGLDEHQRTAIRLLKQGLPEPLWLIGGLYELLPVCREEGMMSKTVFLPYGYIEGEPSYPTTGVKIDWLRALLFDNQLAGYRDLAGVMGNVQTPLLQFPNVYYFTSAILDLDYRKRSEKDVLLDVAGHLYPEQKELLAECWLGLKKESDPSRIEASIDRLGSLVQQDKLGRLGIFARKLFPDHRIVARSLFLQLKARATREKLASGITPTTPRAECVDLLCNYLDAYLAWDTAHGWHELWGWKAYPEVVAAQFTAYDPVGVFLEPGSALAGKLRKNLGSDSEVNAFFDQIAQRLAVRYSAQIVRDGCIEPLKKRVLNPAPASQRSPQ